MGGTSSAPSPSSSSTSFFERTFGFAEDRNAQKILDEIYVPSESKFYVGDNKRLDAGNFVILSVGNLREMAAATLSGKRKTGAGQVTLQQIDGVDVFELHRNPDHAGSVFQCASQFNCLENSANGISGYENIRGQGAASALACLPGAAFRYYLAPVDALDAYGAPTTQKGQVSRSIYQVNCLDELDKKLKEAVLAREGKTQGVVLQTRITSPGYMLDVEDGKLTVGDENLGKIAEVLSDETVRSLLVGHVKVGIQWNVGVCDAYGEQIHVVTQVLCSGAVADDPAREKLFEPLSKLILDAAYEATLLVGLIQHLSNHTDDKPVFLTNLGAEKQAVDSVERSVNRIRKLFPEQHLNVFFVTHAEEEKADTDEGDREKSTGREESCALVEMSSPSPPPSSGDFLVSDEVEIVQIRNFGQRWEDEGKYRPFLVSEGSPNREWLRRGNYYLHGTIGDGACFYHAVAKALNPRLLNDSTSSRKDRESAGRAFKSKVLEKVDELGADYFYDNSLAWVHTNINTFDDFRKDFSRSCAEASFPDIMLYSMKVLKDFNLVIINVPNGTFYCTSSVIDPEKQTIILGHVSSPPHFELVVRLVDLEDGEENFVVHARHNNRELGELVKEHRKSCPY